jgi:chromate transporter
VKPGDAVLGAIATQFTILSLLAFGGANSVIPEIHRQAVDVHHWMNDAEFTALFAISQAAPGPNFMISTLVGWKVAGLAGALVATAAMCGPSCLLAYWVAKIWDRFREAAWRRAFAEGLAPVTVGLVCATFWLLAKAADSDARLALVTAVALTIAYFTRLNFLWTLAAAGGLGLLRLV